MESVNSKTSPIVSTPSVFYWTDIAKRLFDMIGALTGLVLLLPFFALVSILIRHESPGPVFFRGSRSGMGGKGFGILKFRTMYERAESYAGPRVTGKQDRRITPLGQWLRNTKLNELPQLWNVLIGEMSLVGPRPEDPEIVKTWPADARKEILSVRPGITSPASILYRNEESMLPVDGVMDKYLRDIVPDKLRLDRLYVRSRSFMGDLDIIFWTAVALIPAAARHQIPEGELFVGPFYRFVRHYFSWFALDFFVSMAVIGTIGLIWRLFEPIDWGLVPLILLALAIAVFFSSMNVLFGLDHVYWSSADAEDGLLLVFSNGVSSVILVLINSLLSRYPLTLPVPALPSEMILLIGSFTLLGSLLIRYRLRIVTSFASRWLSLRGEKTGFGERVLILGAGEGGEIVHWLLQRSSFKQIFSVIGMVDDDPAKRGMRINRTWVLGSSNDLPALIRKHDVGVVLFAITHISQEDSNIIARLCENSGVRLIHLNDLLGAIQAQLVSSAK